MRPAAVSRHPVSDQGPCPLYLKHGPANWSDLDQNKRALRCNLAGSYYAVQSTTVQLLTPADDMDPP